MKSHGLQLSQWKRSKRKKKKEEEDVDGGGGGGGVFFYIFRNILYAWLELISVKRV